MLPVIDGFRSAIQNPPAVNSHVPVVMLTAKDEVDLGLRPDIGAGRLRGETCFATRN